MTEYSRFHASTAYSDVLFSEAFATVHLDGVDAGSLNGLVTTQHGAGAMSVDVDTGTAWVQGRWYQNTASVTLTIDAADATYTRYDRIVLRWTAGSIVLAVLKGTAAASPSLPALTQNMSTTYEIPIATVTVTASLAAVLTANIADARTQLASGSIGYVIDGGGFALTAGSKGFLQVPFNCKLIGWTIMSDVSGSIAVTVKSQTIATWPAASYSTAAISGTNKPTLSSKVAARSFDMSTWTATIAEGDVLEFVADATPATLTRVTVMLHFVRTN